MAQTLHNYRLLCPNALLFREGKVRWAWERPEEMVEMGCNARKKYEKNKLLKKLQNVNADLSHSN